MGERGLPYVRELGLGSGLKLEGQAGARHAVVGGGLHQLDVDLHPVFTAETSKAAMRHGLQYATVTGLSSVRF